MRRIHANETVLPADLVDARSRAISACVIAWREARARDDFPAVVGKLGTVLDLTREYSRIKARSLAAIFTMPDRQLRTPRHNGLD